MKHRIISIFCVALCVFLITGCSKAKKEGPPEEYSADLTASSGDSSFDGKIYVKKDKVRIEMPNSSIISRLDKGFAWVLFHPSKIFIKQPIENSESNVLAASKVHGEVSRKLVAKEKIKGRDAGMYEIKRIANGKEESLYQWIDLDTGIPIKTQASDGSFTFEFNNPEVGEQSDDLFEVPDDFQEMKIEPVTKSAPDFMPGDTKGVSGDMGDFDDVD